MDLYHLRQLWKKSWVVDAILLICIIISGFLTYKIKASTDANYNSFFLNLTTELLGVWLSVRLIDRLLKKRERLQNARQQVITNSRYVFNFAQRSYPTYTRKDIEHLTNEMKWWERRWISRRKFLKSKCEIVLEIQRKNYELIRNMENLVIFEETKGKWNQLVEGEKDKELNNRKLNVDKLLDDLDTAIEKLLLVFWETDNPDKL